MTLEDWGNLLVNSAVPGTTAFVVLYGLFARWYESLAGIALFTSKVGFLALVWAAFVVRWLGPDYGARPYVIIVAFGVIVAGVYLYLVAFIYDRFIYPRLRNTPDEPDVLDVEAHRL